MGEKIKVGYDASVTLLPEIRGVGRYTLELLRELVHLGRDQFEFVVLLNSLRNKPGEPHRFLFEAGNVEVIQRSLPGPALLEMWKSTNMPAWETLVGAGCDLVHAPSSYIPPTQLPLIVTVFDLGFLRDQGGNAAYGGGWFRKVFPVKLPIVDAIVTPSHHVAADVAATYQCDSARIHPIHLGIDHTIFNRDARPDEAQILSNLGLEHGYILAVSDPNPRKRPELIPSIVNILRQNGINIPVATVGLPSAGTNRTTIPIPWVSDVELAILYRHARAVFLTTREEGFGFPLLEAMACGTPVIAPQHSSLGEIGAFHPIWVEDETPKGFSIIIDNILKSPPTASALQAASQHAGTFSWEKCAKETLALYQEIFERSQK